MVSSKLDVLQEAFTSFDEDGSGSVDLQELIRCLRSLNVNNLTDAQIERRFKEADVDGSNSIDFHEFCELWVSLTRPNEASLQEAKEILCKRVKDRTRTQLQRLASFLQATQPFFQQLQPEVIRDVARFLVYERIPVGGILTKQGEKGDHMYIILSGVANVHIRNTTTFKHLVQQVSHSRSLAQRVTSAFAKSTPSDVRSETPPSISAAELAADNTPGNDQLTGAGSGQAETAVAGIPQDSNAAIPMPSAALPGPASSLKPKAGISRLGLSTREQSPLGRADHDANASTTAAGAASAASHGSQHSPRESVPPAWMLPSKQKDAGVPGFGKLVASLGPGDALGEMALLKQGGLRTATVQATTDCEVVIMHRSVFESLMRTLKGHLLYQAEYLSRLLVKPPSTRSEAEVLKLASYLTSLPRFQEVPQEQLVQVAKEVTYVELTPGATVCKQGDDGDCMYIILKGTCNVHVDPTFDESAQAGALQKASLAPKVPKKKTASSVLTKPHLARLTSTMRLDRMSSNVSTASDSSRHSSASGEKGGTDKHRRTLLSSDGSIVSKSHAMAVLLASGIAGEPNKLTDEQIGVLEQQYGPFDRCLPTGHSFGELSLADNKLARRNATIVAAEPASLIRIDKALYRRTLYEMQMKLQEEMLAFLRQVSIFKGSGTKHLLQLQFALSKCTVQRGHIIIMENQPCAGMFFIQSGQVSILTRVATSHAAHAADTDNDPTAEEEESALHSLDSPHARRSRSKNTAGQLPGVTGKFHQVAVLGPADYVGEVVASKHLFSAVAETTCSLFWLKPQELHMLGHKALGLAMQYNELRQARWHQPQHLVQSKLMSLSDLTATEVAPMQSRDPVNAQSLVTAAAEANIAAECPAVAGSPFLGQHHPHMHHLTRHPHLDPNAINSTHSLSARHAAARPHSAQADGPALQMRWPRTAHADTSLRKQHHRSRQCQRNSASGLSTALVQDSLQTMQHRHMPPDALQRQDSCTAQTLASGPRHQAASQQHLLHTGASAQSNSTQATDAVHARAVQVAQQVGSKMPEEASLQDWSTSQPVAAAAHQPEAFDHSATQAGLQEADLPDTNGAMGAATAAEIAETAVAHHVNQTLQESWPDDVTPYQQDQLCRGISAVQSSHRVQSRAALVRRPKVQMQALQRSVGRAFSSAGGAGPLFSAKDGVMGKMQCLNSAIHGPAYWSVRSTPLHIRNQDSPLKFQGDIQIPYRT